MQLHQSETWGQFHKSWAQGANIEIALLKLGARHKARSTSVKSFSKVGRKAQIGRKTVYEIAPAFKIYSDNLKTFSIQKKKYSNSKTIFSLPIEEIDYQRNLKTVIIR